MTDLTIVTLLLAAVVTLYITRWLPIQATCLLVAPILILTGVLDAHEALSGFSSPATITIGCMLILSAGLTRTGALDFLTSFLMQRSGDSPLRLLLLLALVVPVAGACMNNTPVVVMMVPVVLTISGRMGVAPSRVMIPLSYFAILGGTCTLIGTNTNILVDQLYRDAGGEGFSMFEFAPLGLVLAAVGIAYILTVGRRLLPDRPSLSGVLTRERNAQFVTEIWVEAESDLIGRSVQDVFPKDSTVGLLEIVRGEAVILAPQTDAMEFQADDALILEGSSQELAKFLEKAHLSLPSVLEDDRRVPMRSLEMLLGEAVVLPGSPFSGRTVAELGLNRLYGVKVLAVQRRGKQHRFQLRKMRLKPGDVLFIQAGTRGFDALRASETVLIVEGVHEAAAPRRHSLLALAIMLCVVGVAAVTPVTLVAVALMGCAVMIATQCLRVHDAVQALDSSVLFLLIAAIPLGEAMEACGMAEMIAHSLIAGVGAEHPLLLLSVLYLFTSAVTELLSNKATAVLLTPIALGLAQQVGVDAKPFLMAICFAASASFATPIGYATNTIVLGPGGYRFGDYLRVGLPMNVIMWVVASLLIPVFWPFA